MPRNSLSVGKMTTEMMTVLLYNNVHVSCASLCNVLCVEYLVCIVWFVEVRFLVFLLAIACYTHVLPCTHVHSICLGLPWTVLGYPMSPIRQLHVVNPV